MSELIIGKQTHSAALKQLIERAKNITNLESMNAASYYSKARTVQI